MKTKYFLTTAIPYVNGKPHIGHALEYFQADTVRRYQQLLGKETLLLSGADENALKNVQAAEKEGLPVQKFLDRNSQIFKEAYERLGVKLDIFQRGSDQKLHWPGVQKLWHLCQQAGDIYKKKYQGLYCIGCESFKTEEELINGYCPEHQKKPEHVEEENYFFRLSRYQEKLLSLIKSDKLLIVPKNKRAETLAFIKSGLADFSISRSKKRAKGVGVPVPDDPEQIIYVWFDALSIYLTGIGFGTNEKKWQKWWPADLHIIGKDINRFHTVYWPAMLISAGLPVPKKILVHSFIKSGGAKMSKTVGNIIDPFVMTNKYGLEAVRYYLLSQIPIDEDGDFTESRFQKVFNSDLADDLGNLLGRLTTLAEKDKLEINQQPITTYPPSIAKIIEKFEFNIALSKIWKEIKIINKTVNEFAPWRKSPADRRQFLIEQLTKLHHIAHILQPFLPETALKISKFTTGKISKAPVLFPKLN